VAKAAGVPTVILSHLGPGDPRSIDNARWEALARAGAAKADYRGTIVAPPDLARFDLNGRRIG
jgi:ribonuclease BN (tRNA processing enzyme)